MILSFAPFPTHSAHVEEPPPLLLNQKHLSCSAIWMFPTTEVWEAALIKLVTNVNSSKT